MEEGGELGKEMRRAEDKDKGKRGVGQRKRKDRWKVGWRTEKRRKSKQREG